MKGVNSMALVRLDYVKAAYDDTDTDYSTLLAIGTEKTLQAYAAKNIPTLKRCDKMLLDNDGNHYTIVVAPCFLIERMKSDGGKLPYQY